MPTTRTLYEGENIQVVEAVDEDGDLQRQLLLGPPFVNPQGMIKVNRPKFHVQPFTRNLAYGAVCAPAGIENALFLGLGAGVVIQAVRDLYPSANVDIVDTNSELFSISNEYFYRIDSANVNWFAEDAAEFVKKATRRYDYVCCDVWGHHLEPPQFLVDGEYNVAIKRITGTRGIYSLSTQWFLHKQMTELLTSQFEFVFSIRAPTCLLHSMNARPRAVTDNAMIAKLRATNLDVELMRASSNVIRFARASDYET